jgi:predicted dienelactone hydrolase
MKGVCRAVVAVAIFAIGGVATAESPARVADRPVGFQITGATDADGKAFAVGVWYPTDAQVTSTTSSAPNPMEAIQNAPISGQRLPLVVISHGNGGGLASHMDLALALARAGYVAAAPMHAGDNFQDPSSSGSATLYSGRNRQLRLTIEHVLTKWQWHEVIDGDKVGAFGFSAGGFTVLTAAGAQPEMRLIAQHCTQSPEFICDVLRHYQSPLLKANATAVEPMQASSKIKAIVAAGPGLGFTMTPASMAGMKVPMQLWSGEKDDKVPYATNAKVIIEALAQHGRQVEFHSVPNAGHMSFIAPCGAVKVPELCSDPEGFDRAAFHTVMNAEVVKFFDRNLKP